MVKRTKLQLVTDDGVCGYLPAFTPASSKVRVFVEGRWRTGDNLEEISIERESEFYAVNSENKSDCLQIA